MSNTDYIKFDQLAKFTTEAISPLITRVKALEEGDGSTQPKVLTEEEIDQILNRAKSD